MAGDERGSAIDSVAVAILTEVIPDKDIRKMRREAARDGASKSHCDAEGLY